MTETAAVGLIAKVRGEEKGEKGVRGEKGLGGDIKVDSSLSCFVCVPSFSFCVCACACVCACPCVSALSLSLFASVSLSPLSFSLSLSLSFCSEFEFIPKRSARAASAARGAEVAGGGCAGKVEGESSAALSS